jgi:hypothetical protein
MPQDLTVDDGFWFSLGKVLAEAMVGVALLAAFAVVVGIL